MKAQGGQGSPGTPLKRKQSPTLRSIPTTARPE